MEASAAKPSSLSSEVFSCNRNRPGAIVDVLAADDDGISVVHRAQKAGLGQAYAAGFAAAIGLGGPMTPAT